jgi:hypothetical protein
MGGPGSGRKPSLSKKQIKRVASLYKKNRISETKSGKKTDREHNRKSAEIYKNWVKSNPSK